ncbi:MAG: hypothetical protein ACK4UP_02435 [Spirosomataceae bacterium]|jgi:hypothetical protein
MTRTRLCKLYNISHSKLTTMLDCMAEEDWLMEGTSYKPQKRQLLMPRQLLLIFKKYGSPL